MTRDARLRQLLRALANAEKVEMALRRYPDSDDAIERLERDVHGQRIQLAQELRRLVQRKT